MNPCSEFCNFPVVVAYLTTGITRFSRLFLTVFSVSQPGELDLRCLRWEGGEHSPGVSSRPFWQQIELPLNREVLGAAHRPKGNAVMKT